MRLKPPIFCLLICGLLLAFAPLAFAQVPAAAGKYQQELKRQAHAQWGLDAPVAAFAAQVHQESGWRPDAVSRVGAVGMAQFMPATTRWWCESMGMPAAQCQPTNPRWALASLVGYDKWQYERTPAHMNRTDRLWLALRGYNGGLGHWQAEARSTGLRQPTRPQIDNACGRAKRSRLHCPENLGYPKRILTVLQPRYAAWGTVWN